jgi:hypothetical protein
MAHLSKEYKDEVKAEKAEALFQSQLALRPPHTNEFLEAIAAVLKTGGMDSSSQEKALAQIKELLFLYGSR